MGVLSDSLKSKLGGYSSRKTEETNSVQTGIDNANSRLSAAGYTEPPKPQGNFLVNLLRDLGRTGYAASNVFRETSNPNSGATPGIYDPIKAFGRGLRLEETPTGEDIMKDWGVTDDVRLFGKKEAWYNPSVAESAGFGLDVINPLDLLNWVTFGMGKPVQKSGLTGGKALAKTFGDDAAESIIKVMGKEAVEELGAPSVGKLMSQVGSAATKKGITREALSELLTAMRSGLDATGMKPTDRLKFFTARPITIGLQNPLELGGKAFAEIPIPGSQKLTGALSKVGNSFMNTKVGNALGKAFSTKFTPTSVPDSVIVRDITGSELGRYTSGQEASGFTPPMTRDELLRLKDELAQMPPVKMSFDPANPTSGGYLSFDTIAQQSSLDPNLVRSFFENELPFTMSIEDIYRELSENVANPSQGKALFEQAARLRKTMDMVVDSVPDELLKFFKGTLVTPGEMQSFGESTLKNIEAGTNSSPLINFMFNHKGVDIAVVANTSKNFNDNIWAKLGATIRAIDELPAQNLQALKGQIQVAPVELGKQGNAPVQGYSVDDARIVLGNPSKDVLAHEYGHVWQNTAAKTGTGTVVDYREAIKRDAGASFAEDTLIDDYAKQAFRKDAYVGLQEDFAQSVVQYLKNPEEFAKKYPGRAESIAKILESTQIPPEQLSKLIEEQAQRASTMASMPASDEQIQSMLGQIDKAIQANLTTGSVFKSGSEAYQEFRGQLTEIFEKSSQRVEDFMRQVEVIFKKIPLEERKKIMAMAAEGYTGGKSPEVRAFAPEYAPTFYTKTEHDVIPKMSKSMPVDDFRNLLKSNGVKEDEIKWLGLDEFIKGEFTEKIHNLEELKNMPQGRIVTLFDPKGVELKQGPVNEILKAIDEMSKGKMGSRLHDGLYFTRIADERKIVTKAEVQDWLKWNKLEVQEVVKGHVSKNQRDWYNWAKEHDEQFADNLLTRQTAQGVWSDPDDIREYMRDREMPDHLIENYIHEVSTLPEDDFYEWVDGVFGSYNAAKVAPTRYEGYKLSGGEDYQELLFTLPEDYNASRKPETDDMATRVLGSMSKPDVSFQSQHWSEPNVVAHTRFDTRYTPDGEKVLFIEEIQSDWHQAGRTKGYKDPDLNTKLDELKPQVRKVLNEYDYLGFDTLAQAMEAIRTTENFASAFDIPNEAHVELLQEFATLSRGTHRIERAPFEKTWPEFVEKRLIRYAAENGYDRVAWTTGAQQAERYSLSKTVDSLRYSRSSKMLNGYKDGQMIIRQEVQPQDLADFVGKEIAVKLMSEPPNVHVERSTRGHNMAEKVAATGDMDPIQMGEWLDRHEKEVKEVWQIIDDEGNVWGDYRRQDLAQNALESMKAVDPYQRVLSGINLDVGGEGMKGFYDRMVPNQFDKLGKKFGTKVEFTDIDMGAVSTRTGSATIDLIKEDIAEGFADNFSEFDYVNQSQVEDTFRSYLSSTDYPLEFNSAQAIDIADAVQDSLDSLEDITLDFNKDDFVKYLENQWGSTMKSSTSKQMSMKLTDKMKQSALYEGQPLFLTGETAASELSEKGQAALNAFLKWRDSVVKTYKQLQIPINELENYVPFIPVRGLKADEQSALKTLFGTGIRPEDENIDELLKVLSQTDPNLRTRSTKAKSPAEVNKVLGKEWLTEDAALAMALRGTRAIKGQEVAAFLQGFVSKYGLGLDDMAKMGTGGIPDGYKMYIIHTDSSGKKLLNEVFDPAGIAKKSIEGFFLPEEMATLYNEYAELIFGTKGKSPLLRLYDGVTAAYKKVAYLWNPGHIPRDFAGNVFNGYLMGIVNPLEYVRSADYLLHPDKIIKLPSGSIKVQDLIDQAQKMGVLDVGAALAETPRDVVDRLNLPGRNAAQNAISGYSSAMRRGTKIADTWTRFTGLVHELSQGKSLIEAATQVKKFYFDYFDLTPFERKVMKRIIPFYTWMRKNIPLQLEMLIKEPRKYARIGKAMNFLAGDDINWEEQPEYIRESAAFPLKGTDSYVSPNLPFQDLSKVPTNLDAVLQLLSGVNPIIRAPIESATNTQWFTGEPIEEYPGESREMPLAGLLKMLGANDVPRIDKRLTGNMLDQIPLLRNIDVMTNSDNARRTSRISSFIGGPSLYNKKSVEKSKEYEDRKLLQDLIRKLSDEGVEIPTTKEVKKGKGASRIKDLLR